MGVNRSPSRMDAWMSDDDGQTSPPSLPRDLQLRVCMAMDMDARIRCGLVFRLRVPDAVASRISAALKAPTERVRHDGHPTASVMVCLGSHSVLPGGALLPRYVIERFTKLGKQGRNPCVDDLVLCIGGEHGEIFIFDEAEGRWRGSWESQAH